MNFQDIINFKLIETSSYSISIYSILLVLIIILATSIFLKIIKRLIKGIVNQKNLEPGTAHSITQIIKYIIWVIVIILVLDTVGVKISIFLASAAALLVGVGLGLQQLFNDIASGIVLLFEGSIKIDDVIELDNDIIGKVIIIGIRTSKIKTRDDVVIIVPNSKLVNDSIINWSHMDKKTRFNVKVGVAYGSNVLLVKELLLECAINNKNIHEKPAPFVRFLDFGESSLDFQLFFWVKNSFTVENLKSDLRFAINQSFAENKIQIPFPQRDIHIKSEELLSKNKK